MGLQLRDDVVDDVAGMASRCRRCRRTANRSRVHADDLAAQVEVGPAGLPRLIGASIWMKSL